MAGRSERDAAWDVVREYHAARLAELVERVGDAVARMRTGEIDAFDADEAIFQYSRAAKELWKFCNTDDVYFTAQAIRE